VESVQAIPRNLAGVRDDGGGVVDGKLIVGAKIDQLEPPLLRASICPCPEPNAPVT
jgi:hypothetical protein